MKIISSLWGERVVIDEVEVHFSPDGQYRAAIARRADGRFCIYKRHIASGWHGDRTPAAIVYQDREPERGIYGTLEDARRELLGRPEMSEAE